MSKRSEKMIGRLQVCALSGIDEIGRNCSFVELNNQIIIIDCGLSFPDNKLYGIDYVIPNISYLKRNKHKVKAILITHGHLDHTGALPYVLEDLGNPPIYAGAFANALINERLKEHNLDKQTTLINVKRSDKITIGDFRIKFIGITHSIPDSFGICVASNVGTLYFSGDFRIDPQPANELATDYESLKSLAGKVDLALIESTYPTVEGKSRSATQIAERLEAIIKKWKGRVVVASFSSQVSRIYSLLQIAKKLGRKVVLSGRSLKTAVRIAREQGYIRVSDKLLVSEHEIKKYAPQKLLLLCTGSQGERYAVLNRISLGEHKYIKVHKGDLILMSSSEIPGNVTTIGKMTDRLLRTGAELITNEMADVHATGHATRDDHEMLYKMLRPKNVLPIHGSLTNRYQHKLNFLRWGMDDSNVILSEEGQVWSYVNNVWEKTKQVPAKPILIDGLGIGTIGKIVLEDRQQLAEYGVICVVLNLSSKAKKLIGHPRILTRGFVYVKESADLFKEMKQNIEDVHETWLKDSIKQNRFVYKDLRREIIKDISRFTRRKTERNPMILVQII